MSLSIVVHSSLLQPNSRLVTSSAIPSLVGANVLDLTWVKNNVWPYSPKIRIVPDTKLRVFGTIAYLPMNRWTSHSHHSWCIERAHLACKFRDSFLEKLFYSKQRAKMEIIAHNYSPLAIMRVHDIRRESKKHFDDSRLIFTKKKKVWNFY